MTIIREGKEITLTEAELEEAYREKERKYLIQDIESKLLERIKKAKKEDEFPGSWVREVATKYAARASKSLSNNDGYYESLWITIDYTLDDALKEMGYDENTFEKTED